nr:sugar transferase [Planosporangium thailandense]
MKYPRPPRPKRAFDVVGALVGLVVTLPLWLVIAVLVWIEEPGPIFFIKNSVGQGGVTFRQVKFRSMRFGAERLTGPVASPAGDPRTLVIGRLLRRWHLDELPELINVLAGTMSLVGPRPLRTVLVEGNLAEVPGFAERHTVKPGIACTAQIEKYHIAPAERLAKDLAYIRNMSIGLDLRLLARAVSTTLRGERHRGQPGDVDGRRARGAVPWSTGPVGHGRGIVPGWKGRPTRPATRSEPGRRPGRPARTSPAAPTRTLRTGGRD